MNRHQFTFFTVYENLPGFKYKYLLKEWFFMYKKMIPCPFEVLSNNYNDIILNIPKSRKKSEQKKFSHSAIKEIWL